MEYDRIATCAERIKQALLLKGIKQSELCRLTNIPKSAMSQYISGAYEPKQDRIYLMARALNVNETWLMGLDVSMERPRSNITDLDESISAAYNLRKIKTKKLPMLGNVACGEPIFAAESHEAYVDASEDMNADFCLTAKGDSMINARIFDGDILFIKSQEIVEDGEIAVVLIEDETTVKRVYYDRENNILTLVPENPTYKPMRYVGAELDQIRILGKVVSGQYQL